MSEFAQSVIDMTDEELIDELSRYLHSNHGKEVYLYEAVRRLLIKSEKNE